MLLTNKWLGAIGTIDHQDRMSVDVPRLVRHLLIFDQVTIQSARFREFGGLLKAFGFDGTIELLRSGALRVLCERLTVGQTGQCAGIDARVRKGLLPLHSYSFSPVEAGIDRRAHVGECFENVRSLDGLSFRQEKALVREIAGRLIEPVETIKSDMIEQLRCDLQQNAPHIETAIRIEVGRRYGVAAANAPIKSSIKPIDDEDVIAITNLTEVLRISQEESHDIIQTALLAVGGLNQRIAEMKHYSTLVNFWYRDLPVLGAKLSQLQSAAAPEAIDRRLSEVLALPVLPDLAAAMDSGEFDMRKFLEVRSSDDGKAFRAWIQTAGPGDVAELRERASAYRARLSVAFQSAGARIARLVVTTGLGLVPLFDAAGGAALGILDGFVIDRLLGKTPAPCAFLLHEYASVFRRPPAARSNMDGL